MVIFRVECGNDFDCERPLIVQLNIKHCVEGSHTCFRSQEEMNGWNEMYKKKEEKEEERKAFAESGDEVQERMKELGMEIEVLSLELEDGRKMLFNWGGQQGTGHTSQEILSR